MRVRVGVLVEASATELRLSLCAGDDGAGAAVRESPPVSLVVDDGAEDELLEELEEEELEEEELDVDRASLEVAGSEGGGDASFCPRVRASAPSASARTSTDVSATAMTRPREGDRRSGVSASGSFQNAGVFGSVSCSGPDARVSSSWVMARPSPSPTPSQQCHPCRG
ncbi:hypothetical protein GCM10009763_17030 [Dermacoccus profundi]|uniref:Uncharacterized protein n=1 Tax=Dermacoccus profundi TaxID=322602 RepID=A0ABP4NZ76_9MICO